MLTTTLITLFKRDLNKLKAELELYKDESNLWLTPKDISNSTGTLALHIVGNLSHFVGAILGNTGYIRKRDLEFSLRGVLRNEIISQIDGVIEVVENTLNNLTQDDLDKQYPLQPFKFEMTTEYFLVHLVMHLSYHLGQVNYHRRLLED